MPIDTSSTKASEPEHVVLAGDSAGGGLAVMVAVAARDRGLPRPAGIVALSPWVDFDVSARRGHRNALSDPFALIRVGEFVTTRLTSDGLPLDRALSPLNLDLSGLPPVLIHVGTTEVLEPDAIALAARLAAAGVTVSLKHWRGQVHDFQLFDRLLPEARLALREIGSFVKEATAASRERAR